MSSIVVGGMTQENPLYQFMIAQDIVPGAQPSYELCKLIYTNHPLGKKIVDAPISRSMARRREVVVLDAPECVIDRFNDVWDEINADLFIANTMRLARIYGISAIAIMPPDGDVTRELTPEELRSGQFTFNVYDPLNTAGSLVGILDPLNPMFLKFATISVMGKGFHKSRVHLEMNEQPIYLDFTVSAFGYVGRSIFQRALYPLQSYLQSMIADNLVVTKAGVIVAKIKQPGSIIDRIQQMAQNIRLNILKQARTGNTISVMPDEDIESLDLHNVTYQEQRNNILETIALSLDMPSQFLTSEQLSKGFGEGTEDAKLISNFIDNFRREMKDIYNFMDQIVQYRAWTPEYYEAALKEFPEEFPEKKSYEEWFADCQKTFKTIWPEALEPSKKERVEFEKICYQSVLETYKVLEPIAIEENKSKLVEWVQSNLSELESVFPNALQLDIDLIQKQEKEGKFEEIDDSGPQPFKDDRNSRLSKKGGTGSKKSDRGGFNHGHFTNE